MKLSKETVALLKNFASHNDSFRAFTGNKVSITSQSECVLAFATIKETLPVDFGIMGLSKFLGVLALFDDADIEFKSNAIHINSGKSQVVYATAGDKMIVKEYFDPKRVIKNTKTAAKFTLTADVQQKLLRAAATLGVENIVFSSDGDTLKLSAYNKAAPVDSYVFDTEIPVSSTFSFVTSVGQFNLVGGDYEVTLIETPKKAVELKHTVQDLTYYFTVEKVG